ncbi:nitrilase-related carbon-nitrogen hydrolase [Nesterenkonia xinjiangensis]|uniref:nitrilase-related carbon-nitrogen hydrolase n=1 Tax=Nesterenkonia xinjiangensis TaxID=225327 RepID=UPI0015CE2E60
MTIRVAACQVDVDVDDPGAEAVDAAVREAASAGAQLIVLPELAFSGYVFESIEEARLAAQPLDGPYVTGIRRLSQETGSVIVAGFCELGEGGAVHNSAMVVQDGELLGCYRKAHLWDRESDFFTPGDAAPLVIDTAVGRLAVLICYDLEMSDWVGTAAAAGAEIIAAPCNWPLLERPAGERPLEVVKAQAVAGAFKVHIVVADRCGHERGVDWIGGSVICENTGYPAAGPATGDDGPARPVVLTADLDPASSRNKSLGPRNGVWDDRRPELYWIGCP